MHPHFPLVLAYARSPVFIEHSRSSESLAKFLKISSKWDGWNASMFLSLCMQSTRDCDEACVRFCEDVTTHEYRLLLEKYLTYFRIE